MAYHFQKVVLNSFMKNHCFITIQSVSPHAKKHEKSKHGKPFSKSCAQFPPAIGLILSGRGIMGSSIPAVIGSLEQKQVIFDCIFDSALRLQGGLD